MKKPEIYFTNNNKPLRVSDEDSVTVGAMGMGQENVKITTWLQMSADLRISTQEQLMANIDSVMKWLIKNSEYVKFEEIKL